MTGSAEQARYQVRFDWGIDGAIAVAADADVIVWVDAIATGEVPEGLPGFGAVIAAEIPTARAAAQWVIDLQHRVNRRIAIAVIAAGSMRERGGYRFSVEDLLAAGAVVSELGARGLDATSPEAAVAEAAFLGLTRAVSHLLTASVSAQQSDVTLGTAMGRIDSTLSLDDIAVLRPGR